ncbi:MAG: glycerol-3-phosphate 1-O-acyltransferase PlsY [Chloroflexi bacterium]|nr:glycerol-3-phosphate 1-O-acyltransferase PlsY [Chloroflexota bacterium]
MSGVELPLAALLGYLIGAIPSGVMIGRLRGVDPRAAGSGRTGTTNALRTLGPALAAVVLLLDVAKGIVAVLVGAWIGRTVGGADAWPAALAGVAAVLGHVRSVFIGFGGGRGVATGGGAMLVLAPLAMLAAIPVFVLLVWRTRYVSLGSIGAAVALPLGVALLYSLGRVGVEGVLAAALIGAVVIVAHGENIERLRAGTERKLGHG